MQNGLHIFRIFFLFFPRFGVGEIFVAETSQIHQLRLRFTELVMSDALPYPIREFSHLFNDFFLIFGQFAAFGNDSTIVFVRQNHCSVHKITENSQQFVVIFCLEICPGEIRIFGFRCDGCQCITQNILFSREIFNVFVCPNCPIAGSGNFVAFEIQKLVGRNIRGYNITAMGFQHARENDAVENDVVFADEMHQFGTFVLPPGFPVCIMFFSPFFSC